MAEVTFDPVVRFRPSEKVKDFVKYLVEDEAYSSDVPESLKTSNELLLTSADVKWIYDRRTKLEGFSGKTGPWHFHNIMGECELILPKPEFPPRNPELEARITRLKAQQEAKEYDRMVKNVDGRMGLRKQNLDDPISIQLKELNNYLFIVLQFVVSVASGFVAGYYIPYYFAGVEDSRARLVSSIITAFVIGIADLYFIMKFLLEAEGLLSADTMSVYDVTLKKNK